MKAASPWTLQAHEAPLGRAHRGRRWGSHASRGARQSAQGGPWTAKAGLAARRDSSWHAVATTASGLLERSGTLPPSPSARRTAQCDARRGHSTNSHGARARGREAALSALLAGFNLVPAREGRGGESLTRPCTCALATRAHSTLARRSGLEGAACSSRTVIAGMGRPQLLGATGKTDRAGAGAAFPVTKLRPQVRHRRHKPLWKTHSSPRTASSGDCVSPEYFVAARATGDAAPWRSAVETLRSGSPRLERAECDRKCVQVIAAVAAPAAPMAAHKALPLPMESILSGTTCSPSGRSARAGRAILGQSLRSVRRSAGVTTHHAGGPGTLELTRPPLAAPARGPSRSLLNHARPCRALHRAQGFPCGPAHVDGAAGLSRPPSVSR